MSDDQTALAGVVGALMEMMETLNAMEESARAFRDRMLDNGWPEHIAHGLAAEWLNHLMRKLHQ